MQAFQRDERDGRSGETKRIMEHGEEISDCGLWNWEGIGRGARNEP